MRIISIMVQEYLVSFSIQDSNGCQSQKFALKAAKNLPLSDFSAFNGWLWRSRRRWSIQASSLLHGKRSSLPALENESQEFEIFLSTYESYNIYNMHMLGLPYQMGQRRSYLTASRCRASICNTDML